LIWLVEVFGDRVDTRKQWVHPSIANLSQKSAASEKPDIAALLMISAKTAFYRPTADIAILFYHAFDWPLKADTTHLFQAFL
jgi:hypothetical protein|tara:strand:- start:237 stop:482 length:246 start_codon:yes stop_codon:yes gene_type:complete